METLNHDPLTQADERNQAAKEHTGHAVKLLGRPTSSSTPFIGIRLEKAKCLCLACNVIFNAYNFVHNEEAKKRIPPTQHDPEE